MKLGLAFMWLLHWLPLPVLGRLGKAVGTLLYYVMGTRRRVALTNLQLCFPEMSEAERRKIGRQHFQYFARSLLERAILWWAPRERLEKLIVVDPKLPLEAFKEKPTVLLCPHFVCLEMVGVAITMHITGASMYMRQRNAVFDEALRRGRSRFNPNILVTRQDGIKPILRLLKQGMPFLMLPDMDFGLKDAEFVPFFGQSAATLTALPRIVSAVNGQVIPVVNSFLPGYRGWKVTFYPAWEDFPGGDVLAATRRMNAFIEDRIREHPAEYLWTHRRFKTRPDGQGSVYD